ncbi:DNA polymerase III [Novosphingobium barchaimii LL02]|uniref:DNA polymerase III n=1 Tax=Novosphingobium barchaimii LL02 TaxID=1114963 RepID=A0A0J7Y8D7_9SPHN|nr:hypothetical protein [Novosphingobium barchaimii]KMS60219.1 DNA polymerase III [Novosphingobium barchaimii LL02]
MSSPYAGRTFVFDIETNGLLEAVTRVHCAVVIDVETDEVFDFKPNEIGKFLEMYTTPGIIWVGHNIIGYDYQVIEKIYGLKPPPAHFTLDTLNLARLVFSDQKNTDVKVAAKWKKYLAAKAKWDTNERYRIEREEADGIVGPPSAPFPSKAPKEFPGWMCGLHTLESWGWGLAAGAGKGDGLDIGTRTQNGLVDGAMGAVAGAALPVAFDRAGAAVRIVTLQVNSDGSVLGLKPSTGTSHSAVVGEIPASASNYLSGSVIGDRDILGLADLDTIPASIEEVSVVGYMSKTDAPARAMYLGVVSGGTTSDGEPQNLNASGFRHERGMNVDPNTGAPWTVSAVNALQLQPKVAS